MVIARSPCSGGPLREGNLAQEAGRSPDIRLGAKEVAPLDCKRVSPSGSEPCLASLHKVGVVSQPEMVKPDICEEEMSMSTRKAPRGEKGERIRTDTSRNLGGPM